MKSAICFVLLSGLMTAQPLSLNPDTLSGVLKALKDNRQYSPTLNNQLVGAMMAMADLGHPPSRPVVAAFADALTSGLAGKNLTTAHVAAVRRCIADVLLGSGATFIPASRLRETLTANGVDSSKTQEIVKRYIAIGEEVRGPDDMRTQPRVKK